MQMKGNLDILYEDDICLVLNKPAGLAVQGGKGVKVSLDKLFPVFLVHRLDRDTSGVILTAKNQKAAAYFSGVLKQAKKQYTAVCAGLFEKKEGTIKHDLEIKDKVKKAITKYKVKSSGKIEKEDYTCDYTVLELELGTGRMHQIRRHLAINGTPILGDDKYGNFSLNKTLRKTIGLKRLLLHASRLIIKDYNLDVSAPLPESFGIK